MSELEFGQDAVFSLLLLLLLKDHLFIKIIKTITLERDRPASTVFL